MNLFDDAKTVRELTADYYTMIKDAVQDAIANALKNETKDYSNEPGFMLSVFVTLDGVVEAIDEYLYSECDSTVIYTRDAQTILFVSRNEDAIRDMYDDDSALAVATVESKASAAFLADCRELLSSEHFLAELEKELKNK